jgi:carboxyl-terminal processing protease
MLAGPIDFSLHRPRVTSEPATVIPSLRLRRRRPPPPTCRCPERAPRFASAGTSVVVALLAAVLAFQPLQAVQQPSTEAPAPAFSTELAVQTFDSVWSRVANTHYDPDMGGVDWIAVRTELEPRAREATSNDELRGVLSEMVSRLGLSHFAIFGPDAGVALEGRAEGEDATGSPGAGRGLANPGMDLRLVEDRLVVVRVRPGSPAERAGVRPGWELTGIESRDAAVLPEGIGESLVAMGTPEERVRALYLPMLALARLQGAEGSAVDVMLVDGVGRERRMALDRTPPPGELARFGYLPPFPVEVRHRSIELEGGGAAGWIHFTGWFPAAMPQVAEAVDRYRGTQGLVIDLRGNPGGVAGMAMGIAGHVIDERVSLGEMTNRGGTLQFNVSPQRVTPAGERVVPFGGPVAILLDPLSASTSEIFAAGLQSLGRARIFGEITAGQALPAVIISLPNGDRLMHVVADYTAPGGVRLEGRGVIPDETVRPSREALLAGEDPVLDRALRWIGTHPGN